jgi:hypothetical protein
LNPNCKCSWQVAKGSQTRQKEWKLASLWSIVVLFDQRVADLKNFTLNHASGQLQGQQHPHALTSLSTYHSPQFSSSPCGYSLHSTRPAIRKVQRTSAMRLNCCSWGIYVGIAHVAVHGMVSPNTRHESGQSRSSLCGKFWWARW